MPRPHFIRRYANCCPFTVAYDTVSSATCRRRSARGVGASTKVGASGHIHKTAAERGHAPRTAHLAKRESIASESLWFQGAHARQCGRGLQRGSPRHGRDHGRARTANPRSNRPNRGRVCPLRAPRRHESQLVWASTSSCKTLGILATGRDSGLARRARHLGRPTRHQKGIVAPPTQPRAHDGPPTMTRLLPG